MSPYRDQSVNGLTADQARGMTEEAKNEFPKYLTDIDTYIRKKAEQGDLTFRYHHYLSDVIRPLIIANLRARGFTVSVEEDKYLRISWEPIQG